MRIAHLSDVHLVAPLATPGYRLRTSAVRFGRSRDATVRAAKLMRALGEVRRSGADHLVVSGDLTELGEDAELALFGEVLEAAGLAPEAVTLVPGNHDAYSQRGAWARSLRGALARWAPGSAPPEGVRVVDRDDVTFVAIDTSRPQSLAFSGGEVSREMAEQIDRALSDTARATRPCVLVAHHPPFLKRETPAHRLLDTLRGGERLLDLLARHPQASLLHGHFHAQADRTLPSEPESAAPRIFGAPGVADDEDEPRVRLYEAAPGGITPTPRASSVADACGAPAGERRARR